MVVDYWSKCQVDELTRPPEKGAISPLRLSPHNLAGYVVLPFLTSQTDLCGSLHAQLTLHAEHLRVTSSPDVSMSKAIFSSAENALHSELVLFFALYFVSLCPHTLQCIGKCWKL